MSNAPTNSDAISDAELNRPLTLGDLLTLERYASLFEGDINDTGARLNRRGRLKGAAQILAAPEPERLSVAQRVPATRTAEHPAYFFDHFTGGVRRALGALWPFSRH